MSLKEEKDFTASATMLVALDSKVTALVLSQQDTNMQTQPITQCLGRSFGGIRESDPSLSSEHDASSCITFAQRLVPFFLFCLFLNYFGSLVPLKYIQSEQSLTKTYSLLM